MLKWCGVNHKYFKEIIPPLHPVLVQDAILSHPVVTPPRLQPPMWPISDVVLSTVRIVQPCMLLNCLTPITLASL